MAIRNIISLIFSFTKGIKKIYNNSSKSLLFIIFDFLKLNRQKGITTEEYFQFEFESQDDEFRNSF